MADSSYVAWDGNKYGGEPPEGWYLAADARWWPQGYAPSPEQIESASVSSPGSSSSLEETPAADENSGAEVSVVESSPVSGVNSLTGSDVSDGSDAVVVPDVSVPDVSVPDVSVPDVAVPDVSVPDVGVSDVSVPDVGVPDVSVPDVAVSDVSVPDVSVPDVGVPDVSVPDVNVPDVAVPDVSVPDVAVPDVNVPDVSVPDVAVPDVNVPDVSVPDVAVPDVSVPDVAVPDVSAPDVSVPNVPDVGLPGAVASPSVDVPDVNVPQVDISEGGVSPLEGPAGTVSDLAQPSKSDFGGLGSLGSEPKQPEVDVTNLGATNTPVSPAGSPGNFGSQAPQASVNPSVGGSTQGHGVAFPAATSQPDPVKLPASSEPDGQIGSTDSFTAYSKATETPKKSRKFLWIGLLAIILLAVLAAVAWFVLGSQDDDESAAPEIDQTSENTGSFNKPQEFNEALNIFYDDNTTAVTYRWMVQVVGAGSEVPEIEADSGQTLTAATVKVEYQEGDEGITLDRLMFSSIGSDLTSSEIDQDCTSKLDDGVDLTQSLSPGDTIEGQFCWAVPEDLANDQVLAVSSPEAVGAIYFELK